MGSLRPGGVFTKDGTAVLEAPTTDRLAKGEKTAKPVAPRRVSGAPALRRDLSDDFARGSRVRAAGDEEEYVPRRRFSGLRFRLRGGVPRSTLGRVLAGGGVVLGCAAFVAVLWGARSAMLHDPRLIITSSSSIQTAGNNHLTRAQLLSIFGEDVDRNIMTVPLAERRRELESLPWVEHATVMRLLPNKIRIAITERVPVAFVRQGTHIGLVDGNGVLLEMSPDTPSDQHYSFPVVTGILATDPDSTRAARMKLYDRFTADLDSGTDKISKSLSEVDLSSPEDVMALIPSGGSDILVHLGDDDFLARYLRFQKNIGDWKTSHPNLASVDMRYDREAVLEMKAGTAVAPNAPESVAPVAAATPAAKAPGKPAKPVVKPVAHAVKKPAPVAAKPAAAPPAGGHLQTSFAVPAHGAVATKPHATQAVPQ